MLLIKLSPIRILVGFFSEARREAKEIRTEESYELGRKAHRAVRSAVDAVDDGLRPLVQKTIDFDIDTDTGELFEKEKKTRKKPKKEAETDVDTEHSITEPEDAVFDIPVFDAIAKKISEPEPEEIISCLLYTSS